MGVESRACQGGVEAGAEKSHVGAGAARVSTRRTSAVSLGSASGFPSSSFFLPVLRLRRSGLGVLPFPGGFLAAGGAMTTAAISSSAETKLDRSEWKNRAEPDTWRFRNVFLRNRGNPRRHIPARAQETSSTGSRPQHADGLWRIHPRAPEVRHSRACGAGGPRHASARRVLELLRPGGSGVPRGGRQRRRRPGRAGTVHGARAPRLLQRCPAAECAGDDGGADGARRLERARPEGHVRRVRAVFRVPHAPTRAARDRAAARRAHAVLRAAAVRRAIAAVRRASAAVRRARRGRRECEIRSAAGRAVRGAPTPRRRRRRGEGRRR